MTHKGKKWFVVAQKSTPSMYILPPIFENETSFDVVFHQSGNGRWQPSIKKYGFIIDTEFDDIPYDIDGSAVHKARIIKRKNFLHIRSIFWNLRTLNPKTTCWLN